MLARGQRMLRPDEFRITVRSGYRARQAALITHVLAPTEAQATGGSSAPTRVGLIVGRTVGNAVERNLVKRRLRHVLRSRLDALPAGSRVVIRALRGSDALSSAELAAQVDAALAQVSRRRSSTNGVVVGAR